MAVYLTAMLGRLHDLTLGDLCFILWNAEVSRSRSSVDSHGNVEGAKG